MPRNRKPSKGPSPKAAAATSATAKQLKQLFDRIDVNNDKELDAHELLTAASILGLDHLEAVDIARMMQEADLDGDGSLDYYEFSSIMTSAQEENTAWGKAGRSARLLKGIDDGLLHVHDLVHKSGSKNEDGENVPSWFHRLVSSLVGDAVTGMISAVFCFYITRAIYCVYGRHYYEYMDEYYYEYRCQYPDDWVSGLFFLGILLAVNALFWLVLGSRSQRHVGHLFFNLKCQNKTGQMVTSFSGLVVYQLPLHCLLASLYWLLLTQRYAGLSISFYVPPQLAFLMGYVAFCLFGKNWCFDKLTGTYITTTPVPKEIKDAAKMAGNMTSKIVHNENVQRYATREGMRWCCALCWRTALSH